MTGREFLGNIRHPPGLKSIKLHLAFRKLGGPGLGDAEHNVSGLMPFGNHQEPRYKIYYTYYL